jgi:hypothetical protein
MTADTPEEQATIYDLNSNFSADYEKVHGEDIGRRNAEGTRLDALLLRLAEENKDKDKDKDKDDAGGSTLLQFLFGPDSRFCETVRSMGMKSLMDLFAMYVSAGESSSARRAGFLDSVCICACCASGLGERGNDLVDWFEFSYLGNSCRLRSPPVPWTWLWALIGLPIVRVSEPLPAWSVLTCWATSFMAIASDTRHTEERRGALAHVFQVAVDFIPHDPVVVNKAVMWLAVLAREWGCFSEDKWSDERRTQCFDDLGVWLRSGWKSLPPWKIGSLQRLSSVEPKVSLAALHQYEDRVGMILPLDLRRLLLEVGDVGTALFGVPLLWKEALLAGPWLNPSEEPFTELKFVRVSFFSFFLLFRFFFIFVQKSVLGYFFLKKKIYTGTNPGQGR